MVKIVKGFTNEDEDEDANNDGDEITAFVETSAMDCAELLSKNMWKQFILFYIGKLTTMRTDKKLCWIREANLVMSS